MAAVRSFVREDVFLQPVPAIRVDEAFVREWRREARETALQEAEDWDAQARVGTGDDDWTGSVNE